MGMKRFALALAPWTVLALAAAAAWAYIPPAQFIVKNMTAKRAGVRSIRIVSWVSTPASAGGRRFKSVTIYSPSTKIMRGEALDAEGNVLFGVEKRGDGLPLDLLVLFDPGAREVMLALKRVKIPVRADEDTAVEATSLRRWSGTVVWALGSTPQNKDGSQLWVEKDSFLPLRLVLHGQSDVQFTKYRYFQDLPYPRTIALSQPVASSATAPGATELQEDIQEVQINPPAEEQSFTNGFPNGFTEAGKASSPLLDLIQKYYAGLR